MILKKISVAQIITSALKSFEWTMRIARADCIETAKINGIVFNNIQVIISLSDKVLTGFIYQHFKL